MEGQICDSLSEPQCHWVRELTIMLQDVEPPEMCGFDMQCIYRVPPVTRETNPKAYTPRIVSIGPFHKARYAGDENSIVESMEDLKVKYLKAFLNRTQIPVGTLCVRLQALEKKIRSCYAVNIEYNSYKFLGMILIDACFIIEHIFRCHTYQDWLGKDPLLNSWMRWQIGYDLILLENQLPFFVLEELYNLANIKDQEFIPSFLEISSHYLRIVTGYISCRNLQIVSPKHFTDLLRTGIISSSKIFPGAREECKEIKHVYSASQLLEAGLKFEVRTYESEEGLLNLTYSDEGVLTMPILYISDDFEMFFRNIFAFESCHLSGDTDIIFQYLKILDFLINTEKDVNVLVDNKIIVNCVGDSNAVATMVNSLCSNLGMPYFNRQYFSLCNSLNDFYENPRNKYKAILILEYLDTPWKIASTIAAIALLLLTLIQTICSIISLL